MYPRGTIINMADYSPTPGSPVGSYQDQDNQSPRRRSRSRSPRNPRPIRDRKLYISNFPYDMSWKDVKSLFRTHVGDCFVAMYERPNGKSMGAGMVEFRDLQKAQEAAEKLNRYEINGRRIIVREESERDRRRHAKDKLTNTDRKLGALTITPASSSSKLPAVLPPGVTYQLLEQLGIQEGPITKQVFVANLNYKCTEEKLREVFDLAGRIDKIEMRTDKEGGFRGIAIINFETHLEALNSISMFNNQMLFDRTMTVKMDRLADKVEKPALPEGLQSIGTSLTSLGAAKNGGADGGYDGFGSSVHSGDNRGMGDHLGGGMGGVGNMASGAADMSSMNSPLAGGVHNNPEAFNALSALMTQMVQASSGVALGPSLTLPPSDYDRQDSARSSFGGRTSFGGRSSLDGQSSLDGRRTSRWDRRDDEPLSVFVRNMPFTYTWQMLKEAFRVAGSVEYAEIKTDEDGKSRGFGTVRFSTHEEAKRAVNQFNRSKVNGREIEVRLNYPRGTR